MADVVPPVPPTWDAATFAQGFQALLPTGAVWPRDSDAIQSQVMAALVPTYVRNTEAAAELIGTAFPSTTVELLPEWESTLNLPDPCAGPDPTIAQRQAHVVARLTQSNGPSIPSLTAFAAALGYTITITEFVPARYGRSRHKYGQPYYGKAWAHAWQINAGGTTVRPAQYGKHRYGEPYRTWGNAVLECEMRRIAPAHTVLIFAYSGSLEAGGWNTELGGWAD